MNLIFSTVSFQVQYVLQSLLIWRDFYFWEFCLNAAKLFAWISRHRSKSSKTNDKILCVGCKCLFSSTVIISLCLLKPLQIIATMGENYGKDLVRFRYKIILVSVEQLWFGLNILLCKISHLCHHVTISLVKVRQFVDLSSFLFRFCHSRTGVSELMISDCDLFLSGDPYR